MLRIPIFGVKDGSFNINISSSVESLEGIFEEFFGTVDFEGKGIKLGNRFEIQGVASSNAKMICDISLEEFSEKIETPINVSALVGDSELTNDDFIDQISIKADDKFIDISEIVAQNLSISLPMKRVSPKYREVDFYSLHPELEDHMKNENDIDDRWKALKNISINKTLN